MKKTYISPATMVINVKVERLLTSHSETLPNESKDGVVVGSRRGRFSFDEFDEADW